MNLDGSMLWVVLWLVSLLLFIALPICCHPDRRQIWLARLKQGRWTVDTTTTTFPQGTNDNEGEVQQYRFVMSKTQEDEIREAVLVEKLRPYSMELPARNIKRMAAFESSDNKDETTDLSAAAAESSSSASTAVPMGDDDEPGSTTTNRVTAEPTAASSDVELSAARPRLDTDVSSDDGIMDLPEVDDHFMDELHSRVVVPRAGCSYQASTAAAAADHDDAVTAGASNNTREVPNGCAICLCEFDEGDHVCWSANVECPHAFHYACTLNWLMESGRKHLKRQRRRVARNSNNAIHYNDPVTQITSFPMQCPCCRRDFVMKDDDDSVSKVSSNHGGHGVESESEEGGVGDGYLAPDTASLTASESGGEEPTALPVGGTDENV